MVEIKLTREERSLVAEYGFSERDFIFKCVDKGLARLRNAKLEGTRVNNEKVEEPKLDQKQEAKVATDAK